MLGGSRARGTHSSESDIDIGIYNDKATFDLASMNNIYDNKQFFDQYSKMSRSQQGLSGCVANKYQRHNNKERGRDVELPEMRS